MRQKLLITILLVMALALSLSAQGTAAGWEQTFGVTTHPGSPYPVVVTQSVSAGWDFDGDGNREFIVCADHSNPNGGGPEYPTGASIWLYEANASGGYDLEWSWWDTTLYTGGASFPVHAVSDLDGDGYQEIVLGVPYGSGNPPDGSNPARFYVWEATDAGLPAWNGTTPPTADAVWNFNVSVGSNTRPSAIAIDDIDGDGAQEVAMAFRKYSDANSYDAMMIFSLGDYGFDGDFTEWTIEVLDTTSDVGSVYSATVCDVDNDGHKEAFFATDYGVFMEATGANTYTISDQYMLQGGGVGMWALQATASYDIDGDGVEELVVSPYGGDINIMSGVADLATADSSDVYTIGTASGGTRGFAVGDFDGDGLGEIYVGENYNSAIQKFEYVSGTVTDAASWTGPEMVFQSDTSGSERMYSVAFGGADLNSAGNADLNGNGKPDLVIAVEDGDTTATEYVIVIEQDISVSVEMNPGASRLNTYSLAQNYPNPFNPTTAISYSLTDANDVNITVFDITGKAVQTLVSENKAAGTYSVTWDGRDSSGKLVSSGIYLYRLDVAGTSVTRQMTLLR